MITLRKFNISNIERKGLLQYFFIFIEYFIFCLPNQVLGVKKNIEDVQRKENYPCGQQLLIHNGKVLKDETTLAENKVSEDGFLVVMLSKVCCVVANLGTL